MEEKRSIGLSLEELSAAANEFELSEEELKVHKDEQEFEDWIEEKEEPELPVNDGPKPAKETPEKKKEIKHPPTPPKAKELIGGAPAVLDSIPFLGVLYRAVKFRRFGVLIWVVLNAVAVGAVWGLLISNNFALGMVSGIVMYVISQMIVVGFLGDRLLNNESGCAVIKDRKILNRLQPIFDRVYEDARTVSPQISKDVRFCMSEDEFPNAYASGRKTICITKGLLDVSDDKIEGILAHEFGHMANRDTDESQVIWVGNVFVSFILSALGLITMLFCAICSTKEGLEFMGRLGKALQVFLAVTLINVWVMLGTMICGMSNRQEEYDADLYAARLGRGDQLVAALADIDSGSGGAKGVWKALNSSHPNTEDRVMRLMNYEQESAGQLAMNA